MPLRLSREILCKLANRYGIQTEYFDALGKERTVSNKIITQILSTFNVSITSNADILNESKKFDEKIIINRIEPVIVVWDKQELTVNMFIAESELKETIECTLHLENGDTTKKDFHPELLPSENAISVHGEMFEQKRLSITHSLKYGYHKLHIHFGNNEYECFIISSPTLAYNYDTNIHRSFGVFAPLYAIRSERNMGAGDLTDLKNFISWIAANGGNLVGILPIFAAYYNEEFFEPSPYSPASRLFWNEFYLDVNEKNTSNGDLIDYKTIFTKKRQILEKQYIESISNTSSKKEFEEFLTSHPEVKTYAAFRAKMEATGRNWLEWTEDDNSDVYQLRNKTPAYHYHCYVQWQMDLQLNNVKNHAETNNVILYLDMPLAASKASYDAWRYQKDFILNIGIGAPPDIIFNRGQSWGLPPLHPMVMRKTHYKYFRNLITSIMQKIHMLRIDHVMGLHRLFWIPEGESATDGTYVNYPTEEIYAILCLESQRHKVVLVGENLGTVPNYVNKAIEKHNIYKMYVLQYELDSINKLDIDAIPKNSIASLNTHDMPTFSAYCQGLDVQTRHELGLIPENELEKEKTHRKKVITNLKKHLASLNVNEEKFSIAESLLLTALILLAKSPANFLLINIEDLLFETQPQNIPGTCGETPNWQRLIKSNLSDLNKNLFIKFLLKQVAYARNEEKII